MTLSFFITVIPDHDKPQPPGCLLEESIAPEMMGKVFSLLMTAMTLSMPIGLLVAGPVVEVIGVNTWFFWSGVALIVNAVLCRILTRRYDKVTMKPQVD